MTDAVHNMTASMKPADARTRDGARLSKTGMISPPLFIVLIERLSDPPGPGSG
jgi:hypothetical protein